MSKTILQKDSGFTLVEMLIYMALLTLLFVGTIACASIIFHTQNKLQKETAINDNLLFISDIINQGLSRAATSSIVNMVDNAADGGLPASTTRSGSTQLELIFESISGNSSVITISEFENKLVLKRDGLQNIQLTMNGLQISNVIFFDGITGYLQLELNIDNNPKQLIFSWP